MQGYIIGVFHTLIYLSITVIIYAIAHLGCPWFDGGITIVAITAV